MQNNESRSDIDKILKDSDFLSHFSFDIRPYLRVVTYKKGEYIIRDTVSGDRHRQDLRHPQKRPPVPDQLFHSPCLLRSAGAV